jgi:hypothetical protein
MRSKTEMQAIPLTSPAIRPVLNPVTLNEDMHLSYDAEIQYKRKAPARRMILCTQLDTVNIGEPVMITYHAGMRAYQHDRHVSVSNEYNCVGGFYYTNGTQA